MKNHRAGKSPPLYDPRFEHGSCGVGFVAHISGQPSYTILKHALASLVNLAHRGALDADAKTGDGAGILTQIPAGLFYPEAERRGYRVNAPDDLAVGVVFLPPGSQKRAQACRSAIEEAAQQHNLLVLGWRDVPTDTSVLGEKALKTMPLVQHLLLGRPPRMSREEFRRNLFLARKQAERRFAQKKEMAECYIPSLSNSTIVYKGLLVATQLRDFYLDLQDTWFQTALAVFHQRYSTNTFPNWVLAQPFRFLAHNGEINTLQGNVNWVRAREPELESSAWGSHVNELSPVIQAGGSDSAMLDNAMEMLVVSGRDPLHAVMMLVPEAWENMPNMDPEWRAFYEYQASLTEPWDGPAALAFSDGVMVGAVLDRNGLRPARYKVTSDDLVIMASEVGTIDLDDAQVVEKGRLGPGQMIVVDTAKRRLLRNDDIKTEYARRRPYGAWLQRHMVDLTAWIARRNGAPLPVEEPDLSLQRTFGYTSEENNLVLQPMYRESKEPVGSMGDDTPLAVLSRKPRLLYTYFKQRFAQVTNPAIDPLREQLVMSLNTYLGARGSLLEEREESARLVRHSSPVLTNEELQALREMGNPFRSCTLPALFPVDQGPVGLEPAVNGLCQAAEKAVDDGCAILILSDRGVDREFAPIPMLLAVGAVHHHLIRVGKRMKASIVAETGEAREMHQMATLIGYGASAINPYLALPTVRQLVERESSQGLSPEKAVANYRKVIDKQLLKIMSKMGISTVSAYHGAQIFEAIGIRQEVIDKCFVGTPSRVGGIGFAEIAREVLERHASAFGQEDGKGKLDDNGYYRFRKEGEVHAFAPQLVRVLHKALKDGTGYEGYKEFRDMARAQGPIAPRDLLTFKPLGPSVPLEEVEEAKDIVRRFAGGSMSFGALSMEAHEAIATAFNKVGSVSGSGEGGEDPRRYGTASNSYMKQVASGRFGVTPAYLASATTLEIKMAQGSKPGEGGQLPGHKVTEIIAYVRHTQPGVPLISPAPHHDIYSIEDLAQLIYDLKVVNPRARVAVKLVSEAGVGTIAAGVAKGYADAILIAGDQGGTGASPLSSIKNAGSPWELGLAETQQVLVLNDLRGRVALRTDGGMRTGQDVVVAAMLGAEEYGFGTAAMVAVGCQMARQCHLNTCPVGVATQDPELRKKFWGTPEMLIRYLFYVAEEVRETLASLGARSLKDIIGRPDLLEQVPLLDHPKGETLDLSAIIAPPDPGGTRPRYSMQARNDRVGDELLDDDLLPKVMIAIEGKAPVKLEMPIRNGHRTVGGRIAGEIARRYGDKGLLEHSIELRFWGSAGQSFGAFCIHGMRLILEGEANDYVGKGMHGGEIVLRPPRDAGFYPHDAVIMGNTVLYGATGGRLFAAGRAGERFAVRNSGCWTVVEGTGDHCCEYMTEGVVVVLGPTGRNFGAGMSGGMAFVLDLDGQFPSRYNPEMVGIHPLEDQHDLDILRTLVQRHFQVTGSPRAQDILENWDTYLAKFWKVEPLPHVAPQAPREAQRARRDTLLAATGGKVSRER